MPPAIWNAISVGLGDDDASAHTAAAFSTIVPPLGHAVSIQNAPSTQHHDRRAQAADTPAATSVGLRHVALDPVLALVRRHGKRRVGGSA